MPGPGVWPPPTTMAVLPSTRWPMEADYCGRKPETAWVACVTGGIAGMGSPRPLPSTAAPRAAQANPGRPRGHLRYTTARFHPPEEEYPMPIVPTVLAALIAVLASA